MIRICLIDGGIVDGVWEFASEETAKRFERDATADTCWTVRSADDVKDPYLADRVRKALAEWPAIWVEGKR